MITFDEKDVKAVGGNRYYRNMGRRFILWVILLGVLSGMSILFGRLDCRGAQGFFAIVGVVVLVSFLLYHSIKAERSANALAKQWKEESPQTSEGRPKDGSDGVS